MIPTCYREHTPRDGPSWWRGGWAPPPGWFSSPGPVSAFSLTGLWILSGLLSLPLTHCHLGLLEHWSTKPTALLVYWMMTRCWFLHIYSAWQKNKFPTHIKLFLWHFFMFLGLTGTHKGQFQNVENHYCSPLWGIELFTYNDNIIKWFPTGANKVSVNKMK